MNTAMRIEEEKDFGEFDVEQLVSEIKPIVWVGKRRSYLQDITVKNIKEGNFFDWKHWQKFALKSINPDATLFKEVIIGHTWATVTFPRLRLETIYKYIVDNFTKEQIETLDSFEIIKTDISKEALKAYPEYTRKGQHVSIVRFYMK